MCGIVGVVSAAPIEPRIVERMRDQLVHRGPDHAGLWLAGDHRVCLGHRRLVIIDPSPEANQPFASGDGRFIITYNGEIYNFKSLRDDLLARGVRFRTQSDTEVLVESFRYWGNRCLERLSGMFAFAIWDTVERRLFCARDRVGEKPFYYAIVGSSFIFASELKALVAWPAFRRVLDCSALVDYLSFGFVPDPKSIWNGSGKLPPGHWMTVDLEPRGGPVVRTPVAYWDLEFVPDASVADWGPLIREALEGAAKEMSFADVPVGAFLSGGVDSSSVTAALSKAGCAVKTFTIGFAEPEYDERRWAREISRLYGTTHVERVVTPEDVAPALPTIVWHFDEPFNDYSYLPTYYLCREARKVITVALSGDGGDEVFGGYTKYRRLGLRQEVERVLPASLVRPVAAGVASLLPPGTGVRKKLSSHARDVPAMLLDMLTTGWPLGALGRAARGPLAEALNHYSPMDTVRSLLRDAPPGRVGLVNSMRYLDFKLTLAGDMLVKIDRASMALSLEVRPVYLHRDLLALAARIPPRMLADRASAKKALKRALRGWLPPSILERKKMGLAMPLPQWLRGDLTHTLCPTRDDSPLRELLDTRLLDGDHGPDQANSTAMIHSLLFLDRWLARWAC